VVHHELYSHAQRRTRQYVGQPEDSRGSVHRASGIPLDNTEKISSGQLPAWGSADIPQQVAEIRGKNATTAAGGSTAENQAPCLRR
jgi:hypothetical protein